MSRTTNDSDMGSISKPKQGLHAVEACPALVANPFRIRLNLEFSRSMTHVLWHDSMTMGSIQ